MLFPYTTDTPIYHWPYMTISLIVVTAYAFFWQLTGDTWDDFTLWIGEGIYPVQWITNTFLHADFLHLTGNMLFLWVFGLIVEGKVGPWKFLAIYLLTGAVASAIIQFAFLGSDPKYGLGASDAIFGLMMISLLWATFDNVLAYFVVYVIYSKYLEIPIGLFALIFALYDLAIASFNGFPISSSLAHLIGGGVGLVFGIIFLSMKWVDCEGQDFFSMMKRGGQRNANVENKSGPKVTAQENDYKQNSTLRRELVDQRWKAIERLVEVGKIDEGIMQFDNLRKIDRHAQWPDDVLLKLISQLQKQQNWDQMEQYSKEYMANDFNHTDAVILNLARVMVVHRERPRQAIRLLKRLNVGALSDKHKRLFHMLSSAAQQQIEDGVIELGE